MQKRISITVTGIVIAVTVIMLILNQTTGWSVFSEPAQPFPGEDDHSLDGDTILKPGEATDFLPTPLPPMTPPKEAIALTPGQIWTPRYHALPEEPTRIATETAVRSEDPWLNYVQVDIVPTWDSKQMALWSELIVLGEVVDVQSYWSTSDGKRPANPHVTGSGTYIYSLTTVKVEQLLEGDVSIGDSIRLIQNGGQVGEDKLIVDDGYPLFTPGQLVLVYLNPIIHPEIQKLVPGVVYNVVERYIVDRTAQTATNPFSQKSLAVLFEEVQQAQQIKQEIREGRFTPPPPPTPAPS